MYWTGTLCEKNRTTAELYFERAIELGSIDALPCLARCLWVRKDHGAKSILRDFFNQSLGIMEPIRDEDLVPILDQMD